MKKLMYVIVMMHVSFTLCVKKKEFTDEKRDKVIEIMQNSSDDVTISLIAGVIGLSRDSTLHSMNCMAEIYKGCNKDDLLENYDPKRADDCYSSRHFSLEDRKRLRRFIDEKLKSKKFISYKTLAREFNFSGSDTLKNELFRGVIKDDVPVDAKQRKKYVFDKIRTMGTKNKRAREKRIEKIAKYLRSSLEDGDEDIQVVPAADDSTIQE